MTSQLALLDPHVLASAQLLAAQNRARDRMLQHIDDFVEITARTKYTTLQEPNHVICLMGERGSGKTTILLNLLMELRDRNPRWLIPSPILPDLIVERRAVGPAIVSALQAAMHERVGKEEALHERIEQISTQIAWFSDPQISRDILLRDSVSTRDFARRAFEYQGDSHRISFLFKTWLKDVLQALSIEHLVFIVDDADISIDNAEEVLDFIRYFMSVPEVITVFAADETSLRRRILNRRIGELDILKKLPEHEGFRLFGTSGVDYKRQEVESEISYVDALMTKVLPPATRVYVDQLSVDDRLNHRFSLNNADVSPSTIDLLSRVVLLSPSKTKKTLAQIAKRSPGIFQNNLRSFVNQYALLFEVVEAWEQDMLDAVSTPIHSESSEFLEIDVRFLKGRSASRDVERVVIAVIKVLLKNPIHRIWLDFLTKEHRDVLALNSVAAIAQIIMRSFTIGGSRSFDILYKVHDIKLEGREAVHIINFILDVALAGGGTIEAILRQLSYFRDNIFLTVRLNSALKDVANRHIAALGKNIVCYDSASTAGLTGAIALDLSGERMIPFYALDMADFGIYLHAAYSERRARNVEDDERSYVEALKDAREAKSPVVEPLRAAHRKQLFLALSSVASDAARNLSAALRVVVDKGSTGGLSSKFTYVENVALEWRFQEFVGFWEVLDTLLGDEKIPLDETMMIFIALGELPYGLLADLTTRRSARAQDRVLAGFARLRRQLAERGIVEGEKPQFNLAAIDALGERIRESRRSWPSVDWEAKITRMAEMMTFLEGYELRLPWDMLTAAPPRWREWIDSVVAKVDLSLDSPKADD